jgi:hypothetical protein
MRKLLRAINLGDRYEINARLLPAMVAVVPVTTLVLAMDLHNGHWVRAIGLGSGLEVFLAVLFSKLGHSLGRRFEDRCRQRWGGLPTTRWLMSEDTAHSEQQKQIWRRALETLSGLNLEALVAAKQEQELQRALDDAVLTSRNKIRKDKRAELLQEHNIYYGFSRNLAGLGLPTALISSAALIGAVIAARQDLAPVPIVFIEALFVVFSITFLFLRNRYVCHCADRYAEFFLVTASGIVGAAASPKKRAPNKRQAVNKKKK